MSGTFDRSTTDALKASAKAWRQHQKPPTLEEIMDDDELDALCALILTNLAKNVVCVGTRERPRHSDDDGGLQVR